MSAVRPGGVTFIAVLTWISGLLDIIGGTILLFQTSVAATVEQFGGASQLIASAIITILVGGIVIAVAGGLLRGSPGARIVVTVFQVLSIALSIFLAIAYPAGAIGEYFSVAVAVIILAFLWTGRANAFFRG
ncbi:DUF7144 family membrane protein [Agromyces subbeticus]|uniref:DUF7144 family membrane protein n=1 Tax=Agromyces subbeticus TaxID=293890 RepID=UPI0003B6E70D|nr:hypothetical protein [Agromyces subbeticus]